jgi:glutathione S-transferase
LPHLDPLSITPEGAPLLAAHPALNGWLQRMRARPSMQASQVAPEQVLAA